MGAVWGDYDNDGFEDLFLYRWGRPELFHNDRGQGFTRVTERRGSAGVGQRQHGGLARLRSRRPARSVRRRLLPGVGQPLEARRHADDAGELRVREQRRTQVSVPQSRRRPLRGGQRAASGSRRAAGRSRRSRRISAAPAIRTSSSRTTTASRSSSPTITATFREVGREAGVGYAPKSGMNASVGDVLNQGRFAIYVSNISEEGILLQGNNLWVPTARRDGDAASTRTWRASMGVDLGGWSFGAQFADLNNDGFLDLYVVNGYVSASRTDELLVRLLEDRRRQPARDLRRAELAGDGRPQPGGLSAEEGLDQRRRRPLSRRRADGRRDRPLRRPLDRGGGPVEPRRAGRRRREPARAAAALSQRGRAGPRLDRVRSGGRLPAGRRERLHATAARSARRSPCSGTASSRCRRSPADPGSARRTSGACTSASGTGATIDKVVVRWPSGKTQELPHPEANRVHKIEEPA